MIRVAILLCSVCLLSSVPLDAVSEELQFVHPEIPEAYTSNEEKPLSNQNQNGQDELNAVFNQPKADSDNTQYVNPQQMVNEIPDRNVMQQYELESISPEGILDPVKFNKSITDCHAQVGDVYYKCFMTCEETHVISKTFDLERFKNKNREPVEYNSNWSSRMLNILTFGLLGSDGTMYTKTDDFENEYHESDVSGLGKVDTCQDMCRKEFRSSYKKCICQQFKDALDCQEKPKVPPTKGPYRFDWAKFN